MSKLCTLAMLTLLIVGCIASVCCRSPKVELVYVGDAKVIRQLDNGNYEVTPELIILWRKYKQYWDDNHQ